MPRRSRSTQWRRQDDLQNLVIARSVATRQSSVAQTALDCFASLAMTLSDSILFGDPHLQPIERIAERDLARQARIFVAVAGRIEQVVLVLAHRGKRVRVAGLDMDVAGRAGTAAAAQREQFVEPGVADIFHHGQAGVALDLMLGPVARHHNQLGHACPQYRLIREGLCRALRRKSSIAKDGATEQKGNMRWRSEEHTSDLQSLMRITYAVFCLKQITYTHQQ